MNVIKTANREYANRPKDERLPSVQALIDQATYDRDHSAERTYNLKDLAVVTDRDVAGIELGTLALQSPKGTAGFTHWSFGQLCRTVGAPAGYLRDLPPTLAADCLNHGLKDANPGTTKAQATEAYLTCEQTEGVSPRSFWGVAQGLTRNSQGSGYQDDRYLLDQLAAKVLARGAKLVAA